ncbi:Gfo/Idh/MocA family protein [Lentzea aerocolonigenes]|uniref:Gfo/Idh/MocA family protein n=1 Tax=Lentzea aerocolonigenes TaxID=68170 RepID=UPI0018C8AE91|nr:Gfo/Idh/MocA family oxidoreductase [Lentzea aerocolonigenes]
MPDHVMRIGIVGTENSHVDHIIDHLNTSRRDARVVAVSGGRSERNESLRDKGSLERIVDAPEELLGLVDAVVVADRHGDLHRAHAVPFLREGLPVFVDKPLACTVEDAEAIVAEALAHDAPLTSFSALRWIPDTELLAAQGAPRRVTTAGPVDPASPYGGIFFYGIHPVDVALRLAPGPITAVGVTRLTDSIVVQAEVRGVEVVIKLAFGDTPFHGSVVTSSGTTSHPLVLDEHYLVPGLEAFLDMASTGEPPIDYSDLLRPVHLLHAVAKAIA